MASSKIRNFFKQFDYFGVQFNFHYKSQEKYSSATGGVAFLIFVVAALTYGIISAIPLIKRKNLSIIYYSMHTYQTDAINLNKYSTRFAVGTSNCVNLKNSAEFWNYFKIEMNHVSYIKEDGKSTKEKIPVPFESCRVEHFDNKHNSSYDTLGLQNFICPSNTNYTIQGIFAEKIFQYLEISVVAKEETEENFNKIKQILSGECLFNIYYTDTAYDLLNFSHPMKEFLSTQFTVLKYPETNKMNFYFKIQEFDSYQNYIFDTHKTQRQNGFSSIELYSLPKGDDRFITKKDDFNTFAKLYIRAALEKTVIERKYMKLTEYAADVSSILSTILLIMFVVLTFINSFYANEAVMNKIFQFYNIKKNKNREIKSNLGKLIRKGEELFKRESDERIRTSKFYS